MTDRSIRFSSSSLAGVTIAVGETDAIRADAFLRAFGLTHADEAVFIDKGGEPLALSAVWTAGLDRYAAVELERASRAIAEPVEIRTLWKADAKGRKLLTRRYIGSIDGLDVVVDVNRSGWRFATTRDPLFDLPTLRAAGTPAWTAA